MVQHHKQWESCLRSLSSPLHNHTKPETVVYTYCQQRKEKKMSGTTDGTFCGSFCVCGYFLPHEASQWNMSSCCWRHGTGHVSSHPCRVFSAWLLFSFVQFLPFLVSSVLTLWVVRGHTDTTYLHHHNPFTAWPGKSSGSHSACHMQFWQWAVRGHTGRFPGPTVHAIWPGPEDFQAVRKCTFGFAVEGKWLMQAYTWQ